MINVLGQLRFPTEAKSYMEFVRINILAQNYSDIAQKTHLILNLVQLFEFPGLGLGTAGFIFGSLNKNLFIG